MRDIVVDLWKTTRFNMGYVGEDEATRLIFQLTTDLMASKTFTIEFNVNGEITVINDISPIDNSIIYVVPEIFTTAEGDIGIQVVGYNDGKVIKSPVVYGRISKSQVGDSGIPLKAYHTHDNKEILDKFSETDGKPTYDGKALGGGGGSVDSVNGKTGAVVLTAEDINYDNDNTVYQLMSQWSVDLESVGNALTTLDKKSHTHDNKAVLDGITADKTAEWDGKSDFSGSYNDLTDKPTALKNPYALTIKIGDETVVYDGSAAKEVAIADGTEVSY